jgi:enamine deaminase RidA (YjgF/YER057c/UK114 family)
MARIITPVVIFVLGALAGTLAQSDRLRHLNPPGLSTPTGYTHVVAPQRGRLVFIAGQVAADAKGNVVGKGDFTAQTKQVYENLRTAVTAAGATMADVAKINVYVTDVSQISTMREIRQQYFSNNPPASTLVQVVALARPEYMIEIEAIVAVE